VITAGDGAESPEEFHALIESLWNCYELVGIIEETQVQIIATTLWRKARVIRAENGEVRKRLDTISMDQAQRNSDKTNLVLAVSQLNAFFRPNELPRMEQWTTVQEAQITLRSHHDGLALLRSRLQQAKLEIANEGCASEGIRTELWRAFSFWDYSFAVQCLFHRPIFSS
jgi:hypothetical protein